MNLSLIPVINSHLNSSKYKERAYELSTYGATLTYLQKMFDEVTTSEYMPGEARGAVINGVLNQDIQSLTFDDNTFDLITSNAVLEHVPDDIAAYRECFRTLKPGGALIFNVPLYDTQESVKMAELTMQGIKHLQVPEYHDSRLGGPKSALTFWRHSFRDICDRVRAGGFEKVTLVDVMIAPSQVAPSRVVYAIK